MSTAARNKTGIENRFLTLLAESSQNSLQWYWKNLSHK